MKLFLQVIQPYCGQLRLIGHTGGTWRQQEQFEDKNGSQLFHDLNTYKSLTVA